MVPEVHGAQAEGDSQRGWKGRASSVWPSFSLALTRSLWRWLQCVVRYDGDRGAITALGVTAEQCIVGGTVGGALLVFSPDPRRRMTRRLQVADARSGPHAASASPTSSKTLKFDM